MEIDITHLVEDSDSMCLLSGSRAELGDDAGRITWQNSQDHAAEAPLLQPDQIDEAKAYLKTFGAWDKEEIAAWTNNEVQALVLQLIAGDIREYIGCPEDHSGAIYQGAGNKYYYYLGE